MRCMFQLSHSLTSEDDADHSDTATVTGFNANPLNNLQILSKLGSITVSLETVVLLEPWLAAASRPTHGVHRPQAALQKSLSSQPTMAVRCGWTIRSRHADLSADAAYQSYRQCLCCPILGAVAHLGIERLLSQTLEATAAGLTLVGFG